MKKLFFGLFTLFNFFFLNNSFSQSITGAKVSPNGYLIFAKSSDLNEFVSQLVDKTHGEVREYFGEINFKSYGTTIYNEIGSNENITKDQAPFYILNNHVIVEVQDIVMKVGSETIDVNDWTSLTTITSDRINNETLELLNSGNYNADLMNSFALGEDVEGGIFEFIKKTPVGYNYSGEPIDKSRRPFWGTKTIRHCEMAVVTNTCTVCQQDYRFWIKWGGEYNCEIVPV